MLILDIETSGTSPQKHSVLSVGAIDFLKPERIFYQECRIWDGAHIDKEALAVNGFTSEEINREDKPTEAEIVKEFFDWALKSADHTIAGQNPFFDLFFIQAAAERARIGFPLAHRIIDLHSICYFHMLKRGIEPPAKNRRTDLNSDAVMEYVGLPAEPRPHHALNGAKWEAEAFSRFFNRRPMFPEFEKYRVPPQLG